MFKTKLPQRPWTINYALYILFIMAFYGFILKITKDDLTLYSILQMAIYNALLFGIFKGKMFIRNIFFIISFPALLFMAVGSATIFSNLTSDPYFIIETVLFCIMITASFVMLFMEQSQDWFLAMKGSSIKKESNTIPWNFQLTLIIFSIAIGVIIMMLNISLSNIEQVMQEQYINVKFQIMAIIIHITSNLFLSSLIVLLPFSMTLGYWKKDNAFILTRLITMGVILPFLAFIPGDTLVHKGSFFLIKVLMTAGITYLFVTLGIKINKYFKKDVTP